MVRLILEKLLNRPGSERSAADWFLINQEPDVSEQDYLEFLNWLEKDESNQKEYDRLEAAWLLSGKIDNNGAFESQIAVSSFATANMKYAVAAAIAFITVGLWYFQLDDSKRHYRTNVGEQFVTTLDDGSVIHLNTATNVSVDYGDTVRRIKLHDGEAFFDVEKDPKGRPFIVEAGNRAVRVVGTQFNVKISEEGTDIDVLEGTIELIESPGETATVMATITQGDAIRVDQQGSPTSPKPAQTQDVIAWQAGRIDFFADPLESVVSEFNRYSRKRIIIADDVLNNIPVSGSFRINEAPAFIDALEAGFDIVVLREENQFVLRSPQ